MAVAMMLALPAAVLAGNIPQYVPSLSGAPYAEITDGTTIDFTYSTGTTKVGPDGVTTPNDYSGDGFPIGFSFRMGGAEFDSFIIDSAGGLFLGHDGKVNTGNDAFRVMCFPIKNGIKKCDLSYATTGEAGSRVFTMQYKNAILDTPSFPCRWNVQFRLYEADGRIEIAFEELESAYMSMGMAVGITGWDAADSMYITSEGLMKPVSVVEQGLTPNVLNMKTLINWDDKDYDQFYKPTWTFTPPADTPAPAEAPANLKVVQNGSTLNITVDRAKDAAATVVLLSEVPFTEAGMPVDGKTFRAASYDLAGTQLFTMMLGETTYPLYYGDAEKVTTQFQDIKNSSTYYIRAISANGYPNYNTANMAEYTYRSTQAAPSRLDVRTIDDKSLSITCAANDDVIIAATDKKLEGLHDMYLGTFGTPAADAKEGDEIEGGGTVIYAGKAGEFIYETEPNQLMFFRAWTVKDGILSSKEVNAAGVPAPSYPYEPGIEYYPLDLNLLRWQAAEGQYVPMTRGYYKDNVLTDVNYAVAATSVAAAEVPLYSPALNIDRKVKLTFSFAMETVRPGVTLGQVTIPGGNMPGKFGTGSLKVIVDGKTVHEVTEYNGTMVPNGEDGYFDKTSTMQDVEVEIDACGRNKSIVLMFAPKHVMTEATADSPVVYSTSVIYISNFKVEAIGEAPEQAAAPADLKAVRNDAATEATVTAKRGDKATNTLVVISPAKLNTVPEDSRTYAAGDHIGNGTVLYFGNDADINVTAKELDPNITYYVTAFSAEENGWYSTNRSEVILTGTGVKEIAVDLSDLSQAVIYNIAGIRLRAANADELPDGLYIINGRKMLIRH